MNPLIRQDVVSGGARRAGDPEQSTTSLSHGLAVAGRRLIPGKESGGSWGPQAPPGSVYLSGPLIAVLGCQRHRVQG